MNGTETTKEKNLYKNHEGYRDPTAGEAIKKASRMPQHIWNVYRMLEAAAGIAGLEIIGIRDRKTGKEWRKA